MVRSELRWRPSPAARAAALAGLAAVIAAVLTARGQLVALTIPVLAWLAVALRERRPPASNVGVELTPGRCVEGEPITLSLTVPDDGLRYRGELLLPRRDPYAPTVLREPGGGGQSWELEMPVWGRHVLRVGIFAQTRSGAWQSVVVLRVPVVVTPRGEVATSVLRSTIRRPSYGERTARVTGAGSEFLDVHAWAPGQPLRRVHWAATMRTGELHVAGLAADRNQDVVVIVDANAEVGEPGSSTMDRTVRAAVALVESHLRAGDRVGAVVAGRGLRWVPPSTGTRHLHRVIDLLLTVPSLRDAVDSSAARIPPQVLPPGALAVCLSPLISEESLALVGGVRRRGHPTVVIDVLDREPQARRADQQALRAWRLDRTAIRAHLASRGIVTISWPAGATLAGSLAPLARQPILPAGAGAGR